MGIIQGIKNLLPNKLTASQRAQVKLKKLDQHAGKTAIREAGKTVRSVVSQVAAARVANRKMEADAKKSLYKNDSAIQDAIEKFNSIIAGLPDSDGQPGLSGNKSTSEVGGGSIINGG